MGNLENVRHELKKLSSKEKALFYPKYFKSGPGEYAEDDVFIGVTIPNVRSVAKKYSRLSLPEVKELLKSKIHEERLLALFILVAQFNKSEEKTKEEIYKFYLTNKTHINNWDLVDSSAPYIVGEYLYNNKSQENLKPEKTLEALSKSKNLWERRISIIATYYFIKKGEVDLTLKISKTLLSDKEDLIHKAVGWMLREVWKKDPGKAENFITKNYNRLPRTSLRYSIERMSPEKKFKYLKVFMPVNS